MSDNTATIIGIVLFALICIWVYRICRRGRARIELKQLRANRVHLEAVEKQANEDLRVAEKYARGENLTDEELITLSYFAVNSGMATPQQEQVVRSHEVLKIAKANAEKAAAVSS